MRDSLYDGLYIGLNVASSIGTIAGNAFMNYATVNIYNRAIPTTRGAKPFQRYALYDSDGLKQYRFFNSKGNVWYDKDFRHGGVGHYFPHYNICDNGNRSGRNRNFLALIKWLITRR